MKRILFGVAALVAAAGFSMGPAGAVDEHAPHGGAEHAHHIHTGDGECHDLQQNMEGGSRGLHRATNERGDHDGMWHGTCASHQH